MTFVINNKKTFLSLVQNLMRFSWLSEAFSMTMPLHAGYILKRHYRYTENEFLENLKVCDLVPTKQKAPFRSYLRNKEPGSPAFVQQITKDGKELTVLVLTQNVRLNGVDCAYVIAVEREQIESVNRLQVKQQKRTRQAQTKNSLVQMPL